MQLRDKTLARWVALSALGAVTLAGCTTGDSHSVDSAGGPGAMPEWSANPSAQRSAKSTPRASAPLPGPRAASPSRATGQAPSSGSQASLAGGPGLSSAGAIAGRARTFSTRLATYTSVGFELLPGWRQDDFSETWPAFLGSCKVLSGRAQAWRQVCERARTVDRADDQAIRHFFERDFSAYQIRDDDRRPDGVVTGYFEPEISGSRHYGAPNIYPVYAQPQDMLFADARKLPKGDGIVAARVTGRSVVVQAGLSTRDMGRAGLYALDLSRITRDTLDRKVRLRVEGKRLLPYYTRKEIETKGAPNAKVIAFVNNASALYEMQIQGSGRIRLDSGEVIRIAYAEQNGQPFRPTLAQAASGKPRSPVKVRGSSLELELDNDDEDDEAVQPAAANSADVSVVRTRGFTLALPKVNGAVAVPGRRAAQPVAGSGIEDPSYVFFKEASAPGGGPVGALGVPLSPGRSIAVDPRSTPLGYPVFVSTRAPGSGAPMRRLTIAQDTGGAIRGAVRADYFFGNGQQAATQARRMKERGQLWVLLPRDLAVAQAASTAVRTRGGAVGEDLPECLVADENSCVND